MEDWLKNLAEVLKNKKLDNTKVTVYRGEPKPEFLPKEKLNKDTGRWFSADQKEAQKYANKPNNHLIKSKIKVKNLGKAAINQVHSNLFEREGTLTGDTLKNAEKSFENIKKEIPSRIRNAVNKGKNLAHMSELKEFKHDRKVPFSFKMSPSMLSKVLRFGTGGVGVLGSMFYAPGNIMSEEEEMRMLNQYAGNN